jgi:hypothetical protein
MFLTRRSINNVLRYSEDWESSKLNVTNYVRFTCNSYTAVTSFKMCVTGDIKPEDRSKLWVHDAIFGGVWVHPLLILTFAHFPLCCDPRAQQFPSSKIPVSSAFGSTLPLSSWAERANFRSADWNASNHVMWMAVRGRPHTDQQVHSIYPWLSKLTWIEKHHRNVR